MFSKVAMSMYEFTKTHTPSINLLSIPPCIRPFVQGLSFGLQNRLLEWNDYSYEIVLLFKGIFLRIVIPVEMTNYLRRVIAISLKNEINSYLLKNRIHFS